MWKKRCFPLWYREQKIWRVLSVYLTDVIDQLDNQLTSNHITDHILTSALIELQPRKQTYKPMPHQTPGSLYDLASPTTYQVLPLKHHLLHACGIFHWINWPLSERSVECFSGRSIAPTTPVNILPLLRISTRALLWNFMSPPPRGHLLRPLNSWSENVFIWFYRGLPLRLSVLIVGADDGLLCPLPRH